MTSKNIINKKISYLSNGFKMCGILNKVNDSDEIIVICHARGSSKDSRATTHLSDALTNEKINNFRFDFLSCGESEGDYTDYSVTNMINNLNDSLKEMKKYGYNSFILIGCSIGARIISLVNNTDYDIKKLIFWYGAFNYPRKLFPSKNEMIAKKYGYCNIESGRKYTYDYFLDEKKYVAYKVLYKWNIPKLFMHGTRDSYVSFKSSIKISKKCDNCKLVLIENADHGFHTDGSIEKAIEETIKFIKVNN